MMMSGDIPDEKFMPKKAINPDDFAHSVPNVADEAATMGGPPVYNHHPNDLDRHLAVQTRLASIANGTAAPSGVRSAQTSASVPAGRTTPPVTAKDPSFASAGSTGSKTAAPSNIQGNTAPGFDPPIAGPKDYAAGSGMATASSKGSGKGMGSASVTAGRGGSGAGNLNTAGIARGSRR